MIDKKASIYFTVLLIVVLPALIFCQTVSLRLGAPSVTPAPGVTFTVPVYIDTDGEALGGYTLSVYYETAILQILSIENGTATQFDCAPQGCCISNSKGYTSGYCLLTSHQGESMLNPTGESHICTITFKVADILDENVVIGYTVSPLLICNTGGTTFDVEPAYYDYFYGDKDGLMQMIIDNILGRRALNYQEARVADQNFDGFIDVADVLYVQNSTP